MMKQTNTGKQNIDDLVVDRISDLPDSILGEILSFLSTKEAVATVLLSKRWTFCWRTLHNLDFCQNLCSEENDNNFIKFVNRSLLLHDAGLLNKFSLSWVCGHVSSHSNSWFNTAISKNVHNLSLRGFGHLYHYDLPVSAFRWDSLRSLEVVDTVVSLSDTLVVCLTRLESLKLDQVCFKSDDACGKLISGCPILKKLSLDIAINDFFIVFKCRLSSTSLTRLEIYFHQISSFKLNAPSLEYLNLGGRIREIIIETSLTSLVEAHLDLDLSFEEDDDDDDYDYDYDYDDEEEEEEGISYNSIVEAIRAFGCAKVLTLTSDSDSDIVKALERATISPSIEFKRLVKLVCPPCASLQDFIRSSDNLEVLEIFKLFKLPSKWLTFLEVPRCFSNSLKKVKLYFLTYDEDDYEIIRLILEHGSRLEVVEICCWGETNDQCIDVVMLRERILKFPRKSLACRVDITEL